MVAFWTALALILVALTAINITEGLLDRGVCLGMNGNNLPSASDVVSLLKSNNISRVRLFEPYPSVLEALRSTHIDVTLGVRNEDIPILAASLEGAQEWYETYVVPYIKGEAVFFEYITVGNEAIPGEYSQYIAPAMQNLFDAMEKSHYHEIPITEVTTVISTSALGSSYPPSSGAFADEARSSMISILQFLSAHKTPLMLNVYPYFAYAADPVNIPLDFALWNSTIAVIEDGNLEYYNLFDAMVDAILSAIERVGVKDVPIFISETGWPSDGNGKFTSPELAFAYNRGFVEHITYYGTPKRPYHDIAWFLFEIFEENLKTTGEEQHFGLYHANMEHVYPDIFQCIRPH